MKLKAQMTNEKKYDLEERTAELGVEEDGAEAG